MITTVGFYESMANGSAYAEVNGVPDQSITQDSSFRFLSPGRWRFTGAYVMGINLSQARLNAPSLRSMVLPEIYPANDAAVVPSGDGVLWLGSRGPVLNPAENFWLEISRAGADAQPVLGVVWLEDTHTPATVGPTYTMSGSVAPTLTVGTWVLAAATWNQVLPAGRYEVVGMQVVCNDAIACRIVFPGVSQYRPGVVCNDAYGDYSWNDRFRMGNAGAWGQFDSYAMPQFEFLGYAAGAETAQVFLDVVKVR